MKLKLSIKVIVSVTFLIMVQFSNLVQISSNSGYKVNESSHKLNYQADKSRSQIKITSEIQKNTNNEMLGLESFTNKSYFKNNNKNNSEQGKNKLKFLNDSTKFVSTGEINTATSVTKINGDFTAKFRINKLPAQGQTGIGLSTINYPTGKNFGPKEWAGRVQLEGNDKQLIITDNYVIADKLKWIDESHANFKEGSIVTIFRNKSDVGFRIDEQLNMYKGYFPEDAYLIITAKNPGTEVELLSYIKKPLEFGKSFNENTKPSVEQRLKEVQQKYGMLEKGPEVYERVMEAVFANPKSNSAKSGSNKLDANAIIHNDEVLQSPNGIYTAEIREAELVIVENSGKPNEGILWKNKSVGSARGSKQIMGLLGDGTLFLQSDDIGSEYYWTNKDRKTTRGFTPPFSLKIKDNGELVVEDKNNSVLWTTDSAVVPITNKIGTSLSKMVPLDNDQCIVSDFRKARLCNKNGSFEITDQNGNVKWKNSSAMQLGSSTKLLLDLNCRLVIRDDKQEFWSKAPNYPSGECVVVVSDKGDLEVRKKALNSSPLISSTNPNATIKAQ